MTRAQNALPIDNNSDQEENKLFISNISKEQEIVVISYKAKGATEEITTNILVAFRDTWLKRTAEEQLFLGQLLPQLFGLSILANEVEAVSTEDAR